MKKIYQVFKITWQEYAVYRLNFLVWRLRSFISFLTIYFFWWAMFADKKEIFSWQENQVLTYILGTAFLRSIVFSSRTIDVGGEINQGNLTNYLLKPMNFFSYWFSRDIADKILNILFSFFELSLFFIIISPSIFILKNPFYFLFFIFAIILAIFLYFYINLFFGLIAFWTPESWSGIWGPRFVFMIFLEFFSGMVFPLDILPKIIFNFLLLTPFPYFIYFPLRIILGKAVFSEILVSLIITSLWIWILSLVINKFWQAGLRIYGAEGR